MINNTKIGKANRSRLGGIKAKEEKVEGPKVKEPRRPRVLRLTKPRQMGPILRG